VGLIFKDDLHNEFGTCYGGADFGEVAAGVLLARETTPLSMRPG
jgi:hypothetical protein